MSKKKVPIVAIVGRANVGKSSLFNSLVGERVAIVSEVAGTTRDSITAKATLESGKDFWLVDTAGMKTAEDEFELTIQEQISEAADHADIIMVTVDGSTMVSNEDRKVTKLAFKSGKSLILLVNKADKAKPDQIEAYAKLGIKTIIPTSATQKIGFADLEEALDETLPNATIIEADDKIRIALLGRPNVGKSSLFNSLGSKQQAIVADLAGTTRDVNRTTIRYQKRELELLDTAGIRRSGKIGRGIEYFSVLRSLSAIEEADICLLLVDATEMSVALDQKIAGMVKEAGKGLVLVISKWDLLKELPAEETEEDPVPPEAEDSEKEKKPQETKKVKKLSQQDRIARRLQRNFQFAPWAPLVFTSSVTGRNVTKIFEIALEIMERRGQKIPTRALNNWLKKTVGSHPPAGLKNKHPKLRYMVQEDNPIPAFKIFGSQTKFLHWSYRRHMDRMMREEWDYIGSPIQLWFIDRDQEKEKKFKNNGNRDKYRARVARREESRLQRPDREE